MGMHRFAERDLRCVKPAEFPAWQPPVQISRSTVRYAIDTHGSAQDMVQHQMGQADKSRIQSYPHVRVSMVWYRDGEIVWIDASSDCRIGEVVPKEPGCGAELASLANPLISREEARVVLSDGDEGLIDALEAEASAEGPPIQGYGLQIYSHPGS